MAENFRRRFSFRHLSFRKAKKQPIRPQSSVDVIRPQSVTRPQSVVRAQSVTRPQSVVRAQSVTRPQSELKRSASVRPRSCASRERSSSSSVRRDATKRASVQAWNDAWNKPIIGRAIQPFTAILRCDLTFEAGDQILILTRTNKQFDWWEGSVRGHTGIFPANYIQVLD